MKKKLSAVFCIIITFTFFSIAYPAENENKDNDDDSGYSRISLLNDRDKFIADNGDLPVKQVTIRGIEKTKESVLLSEAGIKPGDKLSQFNPHRFINRLKKKNIFTHLKLIYLKEDDSVIIELSLKEKFTVIPIPMFYSNGETYTYGIFVLESNFLGYNKTIFGGGSLSENGGSMMFGFIDPSIYGTQFAANLFIIYKKNVYQNADMKKNTFSEYSAVHRTFRLDTGFSFTDGIKVFLSQGYKDGLTDRNYANSLDPPDSRRFYTFGGIFKLDQLEYYEYLYFGFNGEINCYANVPLGGYDEYYYSYFSLVYSHEIFSGQRITLHGTASSGSRPGVMEVRISGKTGTRTLPSDLIAADNYANYCAIYEYPCCRFQRGVITLLCFWEQGIYNRNDLPYERYCGPGCGTLFYLKRIALPAVGFNYAQNLKTGNREFSINIGFTF